MSGFLKEPLVHFLVLGGILFALGAARNPTDAPQGPKERVVVSERRIEHLATMFATTWQRAPSTDELRDLVDDFVLEELYYRKALELGLDRDDSLVRGRMRQKLESLTDDAVALTPSDAELQAFLDEYPDKFRGDPRYRIRQVFVNPELHDDPSAHAAALARRLQAGEEPAGDPTPLPASFDRISPRGLDRQFGLGFSGQVAELEAGHWSNPLASDKGLFLVHIDERVPGRLPELAEIRDTVEREWADKRTAATREAFNEELLSQYEVVVEWPQAEESDP